MAEKQSLDDFIKNLLKEGPLSYKEIMTRTIASSDYEKAPKQKMSYNEVFNKLLKLEIIRIEGYELPEDWNPEETNAKRLQSMNMENVIFSLVKTEYFEIINLFKQLDTEDYRGAYYELKDLFKKKIKDIEAINQYKWDLLRNNIVVRDLRDEELLQLEGENEVEAFLIVYSYLISDVGIIGSYGISEKIDDYEDKLPAIKEKYDSAKVYYLKNHVNVENKIHPLISRILNTPLGEDEEGNDRYLKENKDYDDINYVKEFSVNGLVDINKYLESFEFSIPRTMNYKEIDDLFEDVLSYINSQESKNAAIQLLSRALSDNVKSTEFLDSIIFQITGNHIIVNM